MRNTSYGVSEFILHCAIESDQRSGVISALTIIFMTSMFGNLLVIMVIITNRHLHAPMYLYIFTLASIDIANSTVLIPKMLSILLLDSSAVPYGACMLQMFIVFHAEEMEALLLCFMAVDRYIAIVHPLRYHSLITNRTVCVGVLILNIFGITVILPFLFFVGELSFCRTNILPYCFCDYATMVHISCNENPKYLSLLSGAVFSVGVSSLGPILFSYSRVILAALKISDERKRKVFSTCLTHLLVVGLFYVPLMLSYVLPGAGVKLSTEVYNVMVIVGNVLPPTMNPIIYSFRNKEINVCIHRIFTRKRTVLLVKKL